MVTFARPIAGIGPAGVSIVRWSRYWPSAPRVGVGAGKSASNRAATPFGEVRVT